MSELTVEQRNQSYLDFQQWLAKYVHEDSDDWALTARMAFYAGWDAAIQGKTLTGAS